jgi:sec-independent protein translocase protein TatA
MGFSNPIHIAFVLMLLLLVFGAKRLPEIGRSLGSGMRGFKDSLTGEDEQRSLTTQHQETAPVATGAPARTPVAAPAVPGAVAHEPDAPFAA